MSVGPAYWRRSYFIVWAAISALWMLPIIGTIASAKFNLRTDLFLFVIMGLFPVLAIGGLWYVFHRVAQWIFEKFIAPRYRDPTEP